MIKRVFGTRRLYDESHITAFKRDVTIDKRHDLSERKGVGHRAQKTFDSGLIDLMQKKVVDRTMAAYLRDEWFPEMERKARSYVLIHTVGHDNDDGECLRILKKWLEVGEIDHEEFNRLYEAYLQFDYESFLQFGYL